MWTVTQIVEEVSKRTERRADTKIDLRAEFFWGLDEFLLETHFWWGKKRGNFSTVVGSQVYDLALSAQAGTDFQGNPIQPGGGITDFGQLDEVFIPNPPGTSPLTPPNTVQPTNLIPIFDPGAQLQAIQNPVQDNPAAYFIDPNISLTALTLQAPANTVAKVFYTYWAVSQVTDVTTDAIPLLPGKLHWGLVYVLERRVYEFLYGLDDPRWQVSNQRYTEFVAKANRQLNWSAKKVREMSTNSNVMRVVQAHT